MAPQARLNTRLLVGAEDEVVRVERPSLPPPRIEVENAARLDRKPGVPREDPGAMLPGPDGILV
jgi:hypothetical protein